MTLENTQKLADALVSKRKEFLEGKRKRFSQDVFRASDIHECDRYMIYSLLEWNKKEIPDENTQALFEAGIKEEENVKARLGYSLGFQFIEQQSPFEIKNKSGETICRGHIDGKILFNGEAIPVEIKSMGENLFNSINKLEDFNKKPHLRKYLRQMQLYLYGNNEEAGLFILSNFRNEKIIPVTLDYGECEFIISRLERLWELVKKKEYPECKDDKICEHCPFKFICMRPVTNEGAKLIDNEVLEGKLTRREELKSLVDEYETIDEEIKETFRGVPEAYVGKDWYIKGVERISTRLNTKAIPEDIKNQYSEKTTSWITKILKI